jgi:hypothetical protein
LSNDHNFFALFLDDTSYLLSQAYIARIWLLWTESEGKYY